MRENAEDFSKYANENKLEELKRIADKMTNFFRIKDKELFKFSKKYEFDINNIKKWSPNDAIATYKIKKAITERNLSLYQAGFIFFKFLQENIFGNYFVL